MNSLADNIAQGGDSVAGIATQIRNQGDALQETGDAMAKLAADLRDTAEVLRGGLVGDAINAFAWVVLVFVLIVALFFGFTAFGTLIGGIWLHRWIESESHVLVSSVAPPAQPQPPVPPEPPAAPEPPVAPPEPPSTPPV